MIKVREAKESDTEQLEKLYLMTRRQTFNWENPGKFKIEDYNKDTKRESVFVAEDSNNTIVGFISLWEQDSTPFIHHLFVAPEHQRQGIGKLLIQSLTSWLPLPYQLKCLSQNTKALNFYKNTGWKVIDHGDSEEGPYILLELPLSENLPANRFHFRPVDSSHRLLVHTLFSQPHLSEWFYGEGMVTGIKHLDEFNSGSTGGQYWLVYFNGSPYTLLKTHIGKGVNVLNPSILIGDNKTLGEDICQDLINEFQNIVCNEAPISTPV